MNPDRFKYKPVHYLIGIICLIIGLSLLAFSAYILPYLLFNAVYDVPSFIVHWRHDLNYLYHIKQPVASMLIFLLFFITALVMILVAYYASNKIDNQLIEKEELENDRPRKNDEVINQETRDTMRMLLKILSIVIVVFAVVAFFEWLINIPPTE